MTQYKIKKEVLIGAQIIVILFAIPAIVYRGLFYFRQPPDPEKFKVSSVLIEKMNALQHELADLKTEANLFPTSESAEAKQQYREHQELIERKSQQLLELQKIYRDEKEILKKELLSARDQHKRTYYDFALFLGTMWILIGAFIQAAFLRLGLNILGLGSVLIGVIGVLNYMRETPSLSMWLLMLFFSLLAVAFLITGYRLAMRKNSKGKKDDKTT